MRLHTTRSLFDELPATTGSASDEPFELTTAALSRYRRAIERSDIAIVVTSVDPTNSGEILECNTAFTRLLGGARDAILGKFWTAFCAPEDREVDEAAMARLVAGSEEIDQVEKRYARLDDTEVWTSVSVALLRDADDKPVAAVSKLADISARKSYEAERTSAGDYQEARATFQRAIAQNDFELMYEPIFDLDSGRIQAIDAVGPCHREYPELSPERIVDVADDLDLGIELGLWMIGQACSRLEHLTADTPPPRMIVRVPAQLLLSDTMAEKILSALDDAEGLTPLITLEVEESQLHDAPAHVERELRTLSSGGLQIYIGHFGQSVTSLARLRAIPVDGVKLARELVGQVAHAPDARLVAAVISMGRTAELEVIAEGVSSAEHLHVLQELGCTLGKGPFLSGVVRDADLVEVLGRVPEPLRLVRARDETLPVQGDLGPTLPLGAAAEALRISPSTLRRWADDERIRSVRTAGGHRRFPVSEVRRHMDRGEHLPRSELRREPAINSPQPILADLLGHHGAELAERAPQDMYVNGPGWFAQPAARADLRHWVLGVTNAARTGDQTILTSACAQLSERASANGALLIETLMYIGLFFRTLEFALSRTDVGPEILLDLQRIAGASRQSVLFHVDGHG